MYNKYLMYDIIGIYDQIFFSSNIYMLSPFCGLLKKITKSSSHILIFL